MMEFDKSVLPMPTVGPRHPDWNPMQQYSWIRYHLALNDWLELTDMDQTRITDVTWHPVAETPLLDLALQRNCGIGMQWLLGHGYAVNAPLTTDGDRPLQRAIFHAVRYTQTIVSLIRQPMALAAYPSTHLIKILLNYGADPSLTNGAGLSSWDYAIQLGHWDALQLFANS